MIRLGISRRTTTLLTTSVALLCCIPQEGICHSNSEIAIELVKATDPDVIAEQISELENNLKNSNDPVADGRAFIRRLIQELNVTQGTTITIQELCGYVRDNLDLFKIPKKEKVEFLEALDLLEEEESPQHFYHAQMWNFPRFIMKLNQMGDWKTYTIIFAILCVSGLVIAYLCPAAAAGVMSALAAVATAIVENSK